MRIIGGSQKGLRLQPPSGLPVRPTTDRARESLFNILSNRFYFEDLQILDLCSGTGAVALEFFSRGASDITAVDLSKKCTVWIQKAAAQMGAKQLKVYHSDVVKFLGATDRTYDLIFADPPYEMPEMDRLAEVILERNLLTSKGIYILEHRSNFHPAFPEYIFDRRDYGQSAFTFYHSSGL